MTYKVTVIGGDAVSAPASPAVDGGLQTRPQVTVIQPTALPGVAASAKVPLPTVIRPTALPSNGQSAPVTAASSPAPTAVSAVAVERIPEAAAPVHPSAMAGSVRRVVSVTLEELARRFPAAKPECIAQARAVLAGVAADSMGSADWLTFGVAAQENVNAVVKDRLQLLEATAPRQVAALMTRLHRLLAEILDAMAGGFLKKSANAVWMRNEAEIRQLESRLSTDGKAVMALLSSFAELEARYVAAQDELEAVFLAGEYLLEGLRTDEALLLQSRLMALTTSQTMAQENILSLRQDETRLKELVLLVQDGVLVKLPAMYGQLAGLTDKPNETQRYLVLEKLSDLTQFIERKNAWLS
ncbi:hypothetical protein [Cupriavidus sp. CuC1]|uniref:hypothetical protein n=1 Tax=Cupriavidus sp. CuC1 TaxID=3373131 RepID=UPI0037D66CC5